MFGKQDLCHTGTQRITELSRMLRLRNRIKQVLDLLVIETQKKLELDDMRQRTAQLILPAASIQGARPRPDGPAAPRSAPRAPAESCNARLYESSRMGQLDHPSRSSASK